MQREFDDFIIYYNECDKMYIDKLINIFIAKSKNIINFFKLKKFKSKLIIKLWDNSIEYSNYIGDTFDWETGRATNSNRIDILSFKEILKKRTHENENIDYIFNLILHEFVHICHLKSTDEKQSLKWINEAVATSISDQYKIDDVKITCTLQELLEGKTNYINFSAMGLFIISQHGKEYLYKLCNDKDFATKKTQKLYFEAKEYYERKKK